MAIDYSKNTDYEGNFSYTALGKPVDVEPDPFFGLPDDPGDLQERPFATINVKHRPGRFVVPYTNIGGDSYTDTGLSDDYVSHLADKLTKKGEDNWTGYDDDAMHTIGIMHMSDPVSKAYVRGQMRSNPHFQPETLFEEVPSSIEITNMVSDPSMAHTAMTLSAIAKRDQKAEKIIASDDLSPFSSQLVRNAVTRGLPVETHRDNPEAEITNDIDKSKRTIRVKRQDNPWGMDQPETPISPEEVKGARDDIRGWLRGQRGTPARNNTPVTKKGLSAQFLPGMEGFV
jgi:hypothetical protein